MGKADKKNVDKKSLGKWLLVLILIVCAVSAYGWRYSYVNRQVRMPEVEIYGLGEEVEFGKDFMFDNKMEGYSVKVTDAEILTYEEFLEKYHAADEYSYMPEKVYDVEVVLRNVDAAEGLGIVLTDFYIQGLAVSQGVNPILCDIANPELGGVTGIILRSDTEMVFHLPFALYDIHFRPDVWRNLEEFDMDFVATLYPTKKVITLSE